MKKLICVLLCLLMISMLSVAMAEKPGDTVTIYLSITATNGGGAAYVHFDASGAPVTCVSTSVNSSTGNIVQDPPAGLTGRFGVIKADGVVTGSIGTVTFRINDNAKPGRYTISVSGSLAATGVSGSKTFTVDGCVEHVSDNGTVTKAATCTEAGSKVFKCTACKETIKTEEIPVLAHNTDKVKTTKEPTCTAEGTKTYSCSMCGAAQKTEAVPANGHGRTWERVTKDATCTEAGEKTIYCSVCNEAVGTEPVAAKGHEKGRATVSKEPTCTETGLQSYKCTVCGVEIDNEVIPAKGHKEDRGTVTKEATCTEAGVKSYKCTVCGVEIKSEEIPAKGHNKGRGTVTKEATCTETGLQSYKCTVCGVEIENEAIPAKGHKEDRGTITLEPTCTEQGTKVFKCSVCGVELRTEKVAAKGHKANKYVVTKPATSEEDGEREVYCSVCGVFIRTEVIPSQVYYHMNVCSMGIRFRDMDAKLTDNWYMFTPVDLSVDGATTFDLIAGNAHKIGTVTVTVAEGNVTVSYELVNPRYIEVVDEFMTILPSLADVETVEPEKMTGFAFGEAISIQEDLGGDTKVLLFICNKVIYEESTAGIKPFDAAGKAYDQYVEELKLLMD